MTWEKIKDLTELLEFVTTKAEQTPGEGDSGDEDEKKAELEAAATLIRAARIGKGEIDLMLESTKSNTATVEFWRNLSHRARLVMENLEFARKILTEISF